VVAFASRSALVESCGVPTATTRCRFFL